MSDKISSLAHVFRKGVHAKSFQFSDLASIEYGHTSANVPMISIRYKSKPDLVFYNYELTEEDIKKTIDSIAKAEEKYNELLMKVLEMETKIVSTKASVAKPTVVKSTLATKTNTSNGTSSAVIKKADVVATTIGQSSNVVSKKTPRPEESKTDNIQPDTKKIKK